MRLKTWTQADILVNHQREELNQKPNLPTKLDPAIISRGRLNQQAFGQFPNTLQGFEEAALDWLIAAELNPDQRRHLLSRLQRPDYPNLVKLIVADLDYVNSGGFGRIDVTSNGRVCSMSSTPASGFATLDGITFQAAS